MVKVQRKVTYRLYPTKKQESSLDNNLRLHHKLYNTALEQRISAYRSQNKRLSFIDQCHELTLLRSEIEEYGELNAQSCQVTIKRLDLAFQNFFLRIKSKSLRPGFPRFKSYDRFSGFGYKTHGDGWKLSAGVNGKNGSLRLRGIGRVKIRGQARNIGTPKTCEVQHKHGKWYASVTLDSVKVARACGKKAIGIDWGLATFATIATSEDKIEIIENPRFVRNNLDKLKASQRE